MSNTLTGYWLELLSGLDDQISHDFGSHRTSADQIEHAVRERLLDSDAKFTRPISARTSADIYWADEELCHINIKSTDVSKSFHMPNLVGANGLRKIFGKGERFYLLRVLHDAGKIISKEAWDIRDIAWENLQIGALGAGQLQIKNGLTPLTKHVGTQDDWMAEFKTTMIAYYTKEITKAAKRLDKWEGM